MKRPKVFGIGFHKTGTKSLGGALQILGYRVTGPFGVRDQNIQRVALARALELADHFDAFQDNPWAVLYRELDEHFPGSKFILTVRPAQSWIQSVVRHFGARLTPMREWIYGAGSPLGNEEVYLRRYERHNEEVSAYFHERPGDLLTLAITEGEGWEKLCPFLGVPEPLRAFPHTGAERTSRLA